MRYAVISDIHSNLAALEAVLEDATIAGFDELICLGDLVGYGPDPNACIALIRSYPHHVIAGNHDWGTIGKADLQIFNRDARIALNWTRAELTQEYRAYLSELKTSQPFDDSIFLSHGSPRNPVWEYLVDTGAALSIFEDYAFALALVGHTHLPLSFTYEKSGNVILGGADYDRPVKLKGKRMILNPGSVGQPRDMNPDASYAILDTLSGQWWYRRVSYPVEETQAHMREADLPLRLIARLEHGR
ncbi:MAG: metallophosphoesterase family protein [Anaerolineae bacterium]|nr:metallophosphoesterase family protein [Anaerolineae bacterium]